MNKDAKLTDERCWGHHSPVCPHCGKVAVYAWCKVPQNAYEHPFQCPNIECNQIYYVTVIPQPDLYQSTKQRDTLLALKQQIQKISNWKDSTEVDIPDELAPMLDELEAFTGGM